ncbi:MAG: WbqC family protein [Luteimonas sp.]
MTKRIAIVQSSYLPWKGFFDLIRSVDEFVLYDDMQFTRRDWRSRNRIKTANGLHWLTVPVDVKGKFDQKIKETHVASRDWAASHWQTLRHAYAKAPYFSQYRPEVEAAFVELGDEPMLSRINFRLITMLCELLGISTPITWSMDYPQQEGKSERLLSICQAAGASHYLSGPAAKDYMDVDLFERNGVGVSFADYSGYPEYPQSHGPFEHAVSVLDLLFNTGPNALNFMKQQH